jgi:hypothetical protein
VAVAVVTADASGCTQEDSLISALGNAASRPGKGIIPSLIDKFWVNGPNSKHKCIAAPPARMSLFDANRF